MTEKPDKVSLRKNNPESILEAKLFELYYALGDTRNLNKLLPSAKKLDKRLSGAKLKQISIIQWWYDRIKSRDYNQIVSMKESTARNIDELKLQFFDVIKNTIKRQFDTNINKDTGEKETVFVLKMRDFGDLERAIKLMLLLAGEATDIHSVKIEVVETIIQNVINVVSLHIKDPKVLADIALGLKGIERS